MDIGVKNRASAINQMFIGVDNEAKLVYGSNGGDGGGDFQLPTYTGSSATFGDTTEGRIEIYESGTLVLFPGNYDIFLVGGGGNGGGGGNSEHGGGGGGGYTNTISGVNITERTEIDIIVGAATGSSSFSTQGLSLNYAANGGLSGTSENGGNGGSGGGTWGAGGVGGSNGSDGGAGRGTPGTGQHTTTRMFGADDATLYSGGGGGFLNAYSVGSHPNAGGAGAGGQPYPGVSAVAGIPNTGGGGGGDDNTGKSGGSGVVIVRWGVTPALPDNFADNSWEDIVWACNNHAVPSTWVVGNTKNLQIGGTQVSVAIADKDHDDLPGGGKAALTFTCTGLYGSDQPMNNSGTNTGSFYGSNMHSYLRDTVVPQFPDVIRRNIKGVVKKTSSGGKSSSIRKDTMQIWLFSAVEVGLSATWVSSGEGAVYPYYNSSTRAKGGYWWLRSPDLTDSTVFASVRSDGSLSVNSARSTNGVSFGFSI